MQIAYPGQPFPKAVDLTEEAMQAQGHLLLNANLAMLFTVVGLNGKSSTGKMTSGQATSADHAFIEIFPEENPSLADGMRSVDSNQMAGLSPFT